MPLKERDSMPIADAEREHLGEQLQQLPQYDEGLAGYYRYLTSKPDEAMATVLETLSLLEFSVTREEFFEFWRTFSKSRLGTILDRLSPVLLRQPQGGLRIYHESFLRFIRDTSGAESESDGRANEVRSSISSWLTSRGFQRDARAFRYLTYYLQEQGRHGEVLKLLDSRFVAESLANGWMPIAIQENLASGASSAVKARDWPALARLMELRKALGVFEFEHLETDWLGYANVAIEVLGAERIATGLLFDGRRTVSTPLGMKMCLLVHSHGATAPWDVYADALELEEDPDADSSMGPADEELLIARSAEVLSRPDGEVPISRVAEWASQGSPEPRMTMLRSVLGTDAARNVALSAANGELAHQFLRQTWASDSDADSELVEAAIEGGLRDGSLLSLHSVSGGFPSGGRPAPSAAAVEDALQAVVDGHERGKAAKKWLDDSLLFEIESPGSLVPLVQSKCDKAGWFYLWLKFASQLVALVVSNEAEESEFLEALLGLTKESNPFSGTPRACDLYDMREVIRDTIRITLSRISDAGWAKAIQTLTVVSENITTSLDGSPGGPLSPATLLDLVAEFSSPQRYEASKLVLESVADGAQGHRYMSEVASYQLSAARIAARGGDPERALEYWRTACSYSLGYGFRKDPTIWELIDPIEQLIAADRTRGLALMGRLEVLCHRVRQRTDGRGTSGATSAYWRRVGRFDPESALRIFATEVVECPNEPAGVLEIAACEAWRTHADQVSPFVASAFRFASSMTLEEGDEAELRRLLSIGTPESKELAGRIGVRLEDHSRDQRATNGNQYRIADNARLKALNDCLNKHGLPSVALVPLERERDDNFRREEKLESFLSKRFGVEIKKGDEAFECAAGLVERAAYDSNEPAWGTDRFINALGYRLVELSYTSLGDAENALLSLRSYAPFKSGKLYEGLASGLELMLGGRLAAMAFALAWVCHRGDGGWMSMGGIEHRECLARAIQSDSDATTEVLEQDFSRRARSESYDSNGVTKALVAGLSAMEDHDSAFAVWEAAYEVIESRLPALPGDNTEPHYKPNSPLNVTIDEAFVAATLATVALPGYEQKRRALLAVEYLSKHEPTLVGKALEFILPQLKDPTLKGWILNAIFRLAPSNEIARGAEKALRTSLLSEFLSERVLARAVLAASGCSVRPAPTPL